MPSELASPDSIDARLARTQRRLDGGRKLMPRPISPEASVAPLTAAAARLDASSRDEAKRVAAGRQSWQSAAWDIYDEVSEVRRAANFMGDAMSRLRWYVGIRTNDYDPPLPLDQAVEQDLIDEATAQQVNDALRRLGQGEQSVAELMRDAELQTFMAGEGYLIGRTRPAQIDERTGVVIVPEHEAFEVVSVDELEAGERGFRIRQAPSQRGAVPGAVFAGGTGQGEELPDDAFVMRFWRRHPRFGNMADGPLRSLQTECDELTILTRAIQSSALSKLSAGAIIVPARAGFVTAVEQQPGGEAAGQPTQITKLTQDLIEHTTTPISDPGSAAAVAPLIIEVAPEYADKVQHLTFGRDTESERKDRAELTERILRGLPVPIENITGLGDSSTYANARIVTEQTFDMYVAPDASLLATSWTTGYLVPEVRERGVELPERFAIWYDPADLVGRPGMSDAAIVAYDKLEASGQYLRDALGVPEDAAPTDDEVEERLRRQREGSPLYASVEFQREQAQQEQPAPADTPNGPGGEAEQQAEARSTGTQVTVTLPAGLVDHGGPERRYRQALAWATADSVVAAGGAASKVERLGPRLARIDDELQARVHGLIAGLVERVLEKAGAQARNRVRGDSELRALIERVPNRDVYAQLGPAVITAAGLDPKAVAEDVIGSGADQTLAWIAAAHDEAIRVALTFGDIDPDELVRIQERQSDDRSAGWALLFAAAVAVATARLSRPTATIDEQLGESDGTSLIPPGPIRAGLARAGGATGAVQHVAIWPGGPKVPSQVLTDEGQVAGGAVTGPTALDAFRQVGILVSQYVWTVGAPARPFEPHQALDGTVFSTWDDPQLANPGAWPEDPYYFPGDHLGCQCGFDLVMVPVEDAATTTVDGDNGGTA